MRPNRVAWPSICGASREGDAAQLRKQPAKAGVDTAPAHLAVQTGFLRYLVYRDMRVLLPCMGDSSQREDVSRGLSPCARTGRFSLAGAKRSREPFQTE